MYRKVTEKEVYDYLVRMEKMHKDQYGKRGIYPTTKQVELVFGISKERANHYINEIQRRHNQIFRLNPVVKVDKVIKIKK